MSFGLLATSTEAQGFQGLRCVACCPNRISGSIDALGRALVPVTRQIRENPPKEKPGGPPPQLQSLLSGAHNLLTLLDFM